MSLPYNPYYNELCNKTNPYLATMQLAKEARAICNALPHRITESKALDFAARHELPNPKDFPDHRLDRVREYLLYVNDIGVKSAVLASYEESLLKNNLVYEYRTVNDAPRQARIRVIMNILWDSRPHKSK